MQMLLLKYREEIIQAKVAQEHTEETLKSEIMFLKSQVQAEHQEKTTLEETLTQEINNLQEKLGKAALRGWHTGIEWLFMWVPIGFRMF